MLGKYLYNTYEGTISTGTDTNTYTLYIDIPESTITKDSKRFIPRDFYIAELEVYRGSVSGDDAFDVFIENYAGLVTKISTSTIKIPNGISGRRIMGLQPSEAVKHGIKLDAGTVLFIKYYNTSAVAKNVTIRVGGVMIE
jgi:hypothetical protein